MAAKCMLLYGMKMEDAVDLYNRYMSNWGGNVKSYRFDAVVNGKVVKSVEKRPMTKVHLTAEASHQTLVEGSSYDIAAIRIHALSEDGAVLPIYQEPIRLRTEGSIEIVGPDCVTPRGGMCGTYVRTTGETGEAVLHIETAGLAPLTVRFDVQRAR